MIEKAVEFILAILSGAFLIWVFEPDKFNRGIHEINWILCLLYFVWLVLFVGIYELLKYLASKHKNAKLNAAIYSCELMEYNKYQAIGIDLCLSNQGNTNCLIIQIALIIPIPGLGLEDWQGRLFVGAEQPRDNTGFIEFNSITI
jgi:hypothetical protein